MSCDGDGFRKVTMEIMQGFLDAGHKEMISILCHSRITFPSPAIFSFVTTTINRRRLQMIGKLFLIQWKLW